MRKFVGEYCWFGNESRNEELSLQHYEFEMLVTCLRKTAGWVTGCIGLELRRVVGAEGRDFGITDTGGHSALDESA